jgi:hypothetical protein
VDARSEVQAPVFHTRPRNVPAENAASKALPTIVPGELSSTSFPVGTVTDALAVSGQGNGWACVDDAWRGRGSGFRIVGEFAGVGCRDRVSPSPSASFEVKTVGPATRILVAVVVVDVAVGVVADFGIGFQGGSTRSGRESLSADLGALVFGVVEGSEAVEDPESGDVDCPRSFLKSVSVELDLLPFTRTLFMPTPCTSASSSGLLLPSLIVRLPCAPTPSAMVEADPSGDKLPMGELPPRLPERSLSENDEPRVAERPRDSRDSEFEGVDERPREYGESNVDDGDGGRSGD